MSDHKSDLVRSWTTVLIGLDAKFTMEQTLKAIRPFAADHHFNVRECAWSAIRKKVIQHLDESINCLLEGTTSEDENIRRFASEVTRPQG